MDNYTTTAQLKADVGQFVNAFKSAQKSYENFQTAMKNSQSPAEAVANSSKLVSKSVKVGATAVVALGAAAIKTGMDYDHGMSRVKAISGATSGEMVKMNKQAIKLGADTAFSAKEAATGMENLASAGMKPKQIMEAMPGVLDLAAVSGGNVGDAAENAAVALNGFGLSAGSAGHVADVFARAAADTNAEASDMGEALKMVAPQAHAAGQSLEETSAAIGVLSDAGIKGSMAGSNLGMALTHLQKPSDEAKELMDQIGFSAYDSSGKMKPLHQIVEELKKSLGTFPPKAKQFQLATMFGVQGGRAMNVMLDAQNGKLEKLTNSLKNSDGSAKAMAKTMQDDLASSVEQFGGSLESLSIAFEQTFSGVLKAGVDSASDAVGKLTDYLTDNQDEIRKETKHIIEVAKSFAKFLPSIQQVTGALKLLMPVFVGIETFKGIGVGGAKTIAALETMRSDLTLVRNGTTMTMGVAKNAGKVMKSAYSLPLSAIKKTSTEAISFAKAIKNDDYSRYKNGLKEVASGFANTGNSAKKAGSAIVNGLKNPKQSVSDLSINFKKLGKNIGDLTGAIKNPESAIKTLNTKFFGLLQTFGATDEQLAILTNTTMKNGEAVGKVGTAGERATEAMLKGATAAGGMGASLGALMVPALAVAAVAAAIYAAWDSNFMNISGVVDKAMSGIKGMLDSMQKPINAIKTTLDPISDLLKKIFKIAGVGVISSLAIAAIGLATALRVVVDALAAIVQASQAAYYGVKALFEKWKRGGSDGSESMNKATKAMKGTTQSIGDMGSAFKDAWKVGSETMSQFGKSTDKTKSDTKGAAQVAAASMKDVSNSAKKMKTDVEASKADFSKVINTDGVSDKTKKFLSDVNKTLDSYQKSTEKASQKYQKSMTAAEKLTGDKRLAAVNAANSKLASATQKNGQNLVNISGDLDRQLQQRRFTDGTAMTEDQAKILTKQNEKIKEKLLEQNQIYVQAQLSKVANGKKLSAEEQQATITTVQANYQARQQAITAGEQKITDLHNKIATAKDATTKAQYQQDLAATQKHNKDLLVEQGNFGTQMNMSIANGSKLNFDTWNAGLQKMTDITPVQLQQMYLSFVQMNNNTGQQMQAFATLLQRGGTQGVDGLVQALQDGKFTAKEASKVMNDNTVQGLNSLPDSMFKKGDKGQQSFIKALKAGKFKDAGKYLADQSSSGAKDTKKHGKSGKDNGDAYSKELKKKKQQAKSTGKEVAKASADGEKSQKSAHKAAGKNNGESYNSGVKSGNNSARSAGKGLAQYTQSGANSVSFRPVGQNMSNGVANGINANSNNAVIAMRNLVIRVNNEARRVAKIHSPSRLMRDEVGKYLSLGIAEGITDYSSNASDAMGNVVSSLTDNASHINLADQVSAQVGLQANSTVDMVASIHDNSSQKQPAVLNFNVAGRSFRAFVSDITSQQEQDIELDLGY